MLFDILTMFGVAALIIVGVGCFIGIPIMLATYIGFQGDRMRAEQEQHEPVSELPTRSSTPADQHQSHPTAQAG